MASHLLSLTALIVITTQALDIIEPRDLAHLSFTSPQCLAYGASEFNITAQLTSAVSANHNLCDTNFADTINMRDQIVLFQRESGCSRIDGLRAVQNGGGLGAAVMGPGRYAGFTSDSWV